MNKVKDRTDLGDRIYDTLLDFMPTLKAIDTLNYLMKLIDQYVELRVNDAKRPPELR